ncbi:hypothetical protein MKX64_23555 [Paenibacillus sp. FSL M8-0334]|uniref:Lipoprotein n=1 Tax=Paenibacillus campinasensis TaxID=66347 RepID=A0ABW9SZL1_9BACL|nr:hypothetical protein [Paenibacillus campinasensis]MUG65907.1 hypothetical protein [Paenibacillus campinasensis]
MREQTISMIGFAVSAMLFLSACWFSLEIQSGIRSGVEKGLALTEDQHSGVITVPGAERGRAMIYGGSEVLFTLRDVEKGHFDIEVGSVRFPAGSNPETADVSIIDTAAEYSAAYRLGADGLIESIRFEKVR